MNPPGFTAYDAQGGNQLLDTNDPRRAEAMANALAEARLRLLTVLKHVYWGSFQSGLLSPEGIRCVGWCMHACVALCCWSADRHVGCPPPKPSVGPHNTAYYRAFERNVALLVANPSKELDEWTTLEQHVLLPLRAVQAGRRWRRLPVIGAFAFYIVLLRVYGCLPHPPSICDVSTRLS